MSYFTSALKGFLAILLSILLVACGEGDSSSNASSPQDSSDNTYENMRPFITIWDTSGNGVSSSNQIFIKTNEDYKYDYHVDWGDGSIDKNLTGNAIHTYKSPGIYQVEIKGLFPHFIMDDFLSGRYEPTPDSTTDNGKLLSVEQWGDIEWKSFHKAFYEVFKLDMNASDIPNLKGVSDLSYMFADNCWGEYADTISEWDVSNIKQLQFMFAGNCNFNMDVSKWDVSKVKNMAAMFKNAKKFSGNLTHWDVKSVIDMSAMFHGAEMFNSDISTWNVSNVKDMSYMFHASTYDWGLGFMKFNIDISQWDVSNVTNMSGMFLGASAFEQDISLWDVAKVTDMSDMFKNTALSTISYDALLIGWSLQELTSNVSFSAGDSKYSERSEAARLHLIEHFGWVVTDAGKLE